MATWQPADTRDWLSEAAAAYDNENIEEAKAAALIDIAVSLHGLAGLYEELSKIGLALENRNARSRPPADPDPKPSTLLDGE